MYVSLSCSRDTYLFLANPFMERKTSSKHSHFPLFIAVSHRDLFDKFHSSPMCVLYHLLSSLNRCSLEIRHEGRLRRLEYRNDIPSTNRIFPK